MSVLEKAELQEITSDENSSPVGAPVPVQFNPTTLKLKLSNTTEGGKSRGRQTRQYTGSSSTVLSVDLVFDTADEGTTDEPRSVRERTGIVEKYVLPKENGKESPPKLRFQWGTFIIDGVVESVDIDFDHFASNGTPLRAKVALSIKEQDAKYQFLQSGPGANRGGAEPDSGEPSGAGPGSSAQPADRIAAALAGETAADFANRMGLEPAAWRGLDVDLSAGLTLEAGIEVGFNAGLSLDVGLGVTAGISAGLDVSAEASLGLDLAGVSAGAAGLALAAAGGVQAAVQQVEIARTELAVESTRDAFPSPAGLAAAAVAGRATTQLLPATDAATHAPLATSGLPSLARQAAAPSAPPPPQVDARAATFGFGVPLRTSVTTAAQDRSRVVLGRDEAANTTSPGFRTSPSTPPWVQLPQRDAGRRAADAIQTGRATVASCTCCGPTPRERDRSVE